MLMTVNCDHNAMSKRQKGYKHKNENQSVTQISNADLVRPFWACIFF